MSEQIIVMSSPELLDLFREAIQPVVSDEVRKGLREALRKEYSTQRDAVEITGWTTRQLAYKRAKGELAYIKRGRTILYRTRDLFDWLEEGYVPKSSTATQKI